MYLIPTPKLLPSKEESIRSNSLPWCIGPCHYPWNNHGMSTLNAHQLADSICAADILLGGCACAAELSGSGFIAKFCQQATIQVNRVSPVARLCERDSLYCFRRQMRVLTSVYMLPYKLWLMVDMPTRCLGFEYKVKFEVFCFSCALQQHWLKQSHTSSSCWPAEN